MAESPGVELPQWTPGGGVVAGRATYTSLPINQTMFPPEGTGNSDQNGFFQTAILTTKIVVGSGGGAIRFGGDDAFVALGDNVAGQLGGVHPFTQTTSVAVTTPRTYTLTRVSADRHIVDAQAYLALTGKSARSRSRRPGRCLS